jgi:hypothetical protein
MLTAALVIFASCPADAATWSFAGHGTDGRVVFIDTAVTRTTNGRVRAWVKTDFSKVKTTRAREGKELYEYDCSARTAAVISWIDYAPDGSILGSDTDPYPAHKPVVPESVGEILIGLACT